AEKARATARWRPSGSAFSYGLPGASSSTPCSLSAAESKEGSGEGSAATAAGALTEGAGEGGRCSGGGVVTRAGGGGAIATGGGGGGVGAGGGGGFAPVAAGGGACASTGGAERVFIASAARAAARSRRSLSARTSASA